VQALWQNSPQAAKYLRSNSISPAWKQPPKPDRNTKKPNYKSEQQVNFFAMIGRKAGVK
jgi:hypothetical protein